MFIYLLLAVSFGGYGEYEMPEAPEAPEAPEMPENYFPGMPLPGYPVVGTGGTESGGVAPAYNPYMGFNPNPVSPFKSLPNANTPNVMAVFGDGIDSKDAGMFIAAGMYPRYLPPLVDGVDASEMWYYGLQPSMTTGQLPTEAEVIAQAKLRYPQTALLGRPANEELMPVWNQIVMMGLNRIPTTTTAAAAGGAEGGDTGATSDPAAADASTEAAATQAPVATQPAASNPYVPAYPGGMPLIAGEGALEEYGDLEANNAIRALGCPIPVLAPEDAYMVCIGQTLETNCNKCSMIGCMWTGTSCMGGRQLANVRPTLQKNTQATTDMNPIYTLSLGVLAGTLFGCALGMAYSRCSSKPSSFEEAMIHLDNARV